MYFEIIIKPEMALVEIFPDRDEEPFLMNNQFQSYQWPVNARIHVIVSHGINLTIPECFGFSTNRLEI